MIHHIVECTNFDLLAIFLENIFIEWYNYDSGLSINAKSNMKFSQSPIKTISYGAKKSNMIFSQSHIKTTSYGALLFPSLLSVLWIIIKISTSLIRLLIADEAPIANIFFTITVTFCWNCNNSFMLLDLRNIKVQHSSKTL